MIARPRRRWTSLLACLPLAAIAAVATPASGHAAAPAFGSSTPVSYIVHTDEADIYLEVVHPTLNGQIVTAPVILTYTPYAVLGRNGDAAHWTALGYARATADVIGTGNSGGCWDYGGNAEKHTAYEVVEWIAAQSWSTGKIGMLGGSYEGTTQYAAAVMHPPHLTTIVPEAAIDRWYDYAYAGGIRYTYTNQPLGYEGAGTAGDEGIDTPLAFDFGLALPPPIDNSDPNWQSRVASKISPCDALAHTAKGYSMTPDYDGFWLDRDYLKDLGTVTIPVLVASNWGDWNVKQFDGWQAYHALTHSQFARMFFGSAWHGHGTPPNAGTPAGMDNYSTTVDKWMAHWLMGVDNGLETSLPPVTSATTDSAGVKSDRYIAGDEPFTTPVNLYLSHAADGSWALSPDATAAAVGSPAASFTWTNTNTETAAALTPFAGQGYMGFISPVLGQDIRLFGEPVLHVWSTVQRQWVTMQPSLIDYDPARYQGSGASTMATDNHALIATTRGWLDSRYRNGLSGQVLVTPGTPFAMDVALWPTDYTVRAGHRLLLLVSTEAIDWGIAKPYSDPSTSPTVQLGYEQAQSYLTLPVVGTVVSSDALFQPPNQLPDVPLPAVLPLLALAVAVPLARRRRPV
jgi:X-Pro dipeptidyl-peptidase